MELKKTILPAAELHSIRGSYECATCGKKLNTETNHFYSLAQIFLRFGLIESRVLCENCGKEVSDFIITLIKKEEAKHDTE
jgi:DNA-directed RNA polymerase subunit RPC12/RpoP